MAASPASAAGPTRALAVAVAGAAVLVAVAGALGQTLGCAPLWPGDLPTPGPRPGLLPWLIAWPALLVWLLLCAALGRYLRDERLAAEPTTAPQAPGGPAITAAPQAPGAPAITAATWVTLLRGLLVSGVVALIPLVACGPVILWAAALAYSLAAALDGVDGAVARRRGVSRVGARLDVLTDAVGLLVAPLFGVIAGRLPPWYLLLGLAYPALQAGLALRQHLRLPVHRERLRPDPRARLMAGVQMVVVSVALYPVVPTWFIWPAATLAMLPTLALFAREWRQATAQA